MQITLKELKQIIKETLVENSVTVSEPMVHSWVKFVGRHPKKHKELELMWNIMTSGEYDKSNLSSVPAELHNGIRWHARKIKLNTMYPTWKEVVEELRRLITTNKADQKRRSSLPIDYKANPKYQAASAAEKQTWHVYGGDPNDQHRGGLGT